MFTKVTVCGRLTQEPALRETVNKIPFMRFGVAVNNVRMMNAAPTYVDCVAWRGVATNMSKFLRKGSLILVDGSLRSDNRQNVEVVADFVYFLDSKQLSKEKAEQTSTPVHTTTISASKDEQTSSNDDASKKDTSHNSSLDDDSSEEKGIDWNAE